MSILTLNIGLAVGDTVPAGQLVKSLKYVCELFSPLQLQTELKSSQSELTLVVELETVSSDLLARVDLLSNALDQDAIAGQLDGVGFLVGPKAEDWGGSFNTEFFLFPSWR